MIKDAIFYGNIMGLLKTGRWSVSLEEAKALVAIYNEAERRKSPPLVVEKSEPIKASKKDKKDANK